MPNNTPQSWIDYAIMPPVDPRLLIADCYINGPGGNDPGVFTRSATFFSATWVASTISIKGDPTCITLASDQLIMIQDAIQWTHQHTGSRNADTTLAPPLSKLSFLRGGPLWQMQIPLNMGASTFVEIMLTFRDNALTQGDFTGTTGPTMPVFLFNQHNYSGAANFLYLTLRQMGRFSMILRCKDNAGNYSVFEMEWIVEN